MCFSTSTFNKKTNTSLICWEWPAVLLWCKTVSYLNEHQRFLTFFMFHHARDKS